MLGTFPLATLTAGSEGKVTGRLNDGGAEEKYGRWSGVRRFLADICIRVCVCVYGFYLVSITYFPLKLFLIPF